MFLSSHIGTHLTLSGKSTESQFLSCYINCYTTESRFCYIEIVTTECNMNSDKMESLFHCITIYVVESYFCCASFSKKNDFVAQRKFDSIIHYVTKSYFCYTFLIDLHLYNIIMILRCNFFAHLATQWKHTSAKLVGCKKRVQCFSYLH